VRISLTINDKQHELEVDSTDSLLKVLRNKLGLMGTKEGCGEGDCGVCTVLLDKKPVYSCLVLAVEADGHEVITIEGVAQIDKWRLLQEQMVKSGAVQCGFCAPGMVLTALSVIDENPAITPEELKRAMAGNLCRCGTYMRVLEAVLEYKVASSDTGLKQ
jgi:aerobic-type carbon monoxide dehydrogenase small subunit (CoxS/CutS family)